MEIVALVLFLVQVMAWLVLPSAGNKSHGVSVPEYSSIGDEIGVAA